MIRTLLKISGAASVLLAAALPGRAQVANYSFTRDTTTFASVTGTALATATGNTGSTSLDDAIYASSTFPFSFRFNGTVYTSCNVSTNGFITFGATTPGSGEYTPISSATAYAGAVSAFGGDLNTFFNLSSRTGDIRQSVEGTAPNQEVVFQWTDFRPAYTTSTTNAYGFSFQIRLRQADSSIAIVYGPGSFAVGSTAVTATRQIGLRGATNADFNNRVNSTSVSFNASTAGTTNGALQSFNTNTSPPGVPVSGLRYTYTPPVPCSGTPVAGTPAATTYNVCPGTTATIAVSGGSTGVTGITRQFDSSLSSTGPFVPVVGGSGGTTASYTTTPFAGTTVYYRLRVTCTNSGITDSTAVVAVAGPAAPTTQASALVAATGVGAATLTYAAGSGNNRLVYINTVNSFTPPASGATIATAANTVYAGTGEQLVFDGTGTSVTVTGLTSGSTYFVTVYETQKCGTGVGVATYYANSTTSSANQVSFTAVNNDLPTGAIALTLGAPCSSSTFSNANSGHTTGEPFASCNGTGGFNSVWFKFTAPASGAVKISNDSISGQGDSRVALFSATDSSDFSTFTILGCDDDNGVALGTRSIFAVAGLTAGQRYYISVDGFNSGSVTGSFCMSVSSLDSSMLAPTGSCISAQGVSAAVDYIGWTTLVDGSSGKIIASMRQQTAGATGPSYSGATTVNSTGTPRRDSTDAAALPYYLNRNWFINGPSTGNFDVQVYFRNTELAALQAVNPGASLPALYARRQSGSTCRPNLDTAAAAGVETSITQSTSGTSLNLTYVQFVTPGFSNFFLEGPTPPLAIHGLNVAAANEGLRNRISWTVAGEEPGTVYNVERSADGRTFSALAQAAGSGRATRYEHVDAQPISGLNYYRIRAVEASGAATLSTVVTAFVQTGDAFAFQAFPNPLAGSTALSVRAFGARSGAATVTVTDATGKTVRSAALAGAATTIDFAGLPSGLYLVRYTDDARTEVVKVTKQ